MDYKNHCRTCLTKGREMRHVEATVKIGGSEIRLSDILHNFYNYKVSPEQHLMYPENICIHCIHHLTLTYSFKSLIESSWRTLQEQSFKKCNEGDDYCCNYGSDDNTPLSESFVMSAHQERDLTLLIDDKPNTEQKVINLEQPKVKQKLTNQRKTEKELKKNKSSDKLYFCVECKKDFNKPNALKKHCSDNHAIRNSVGRDCEYCYEKFDNFKKLFIHKKLHLKPYVCLTCRNGFINESELKSHTCPQLLPKKPTGERMLYQCDQCKKSYPKGYIKLHMATHGNDLKYSCKYCPKKFKVRCSLNSHVLWNHKRTKNHQCELCGETFISASVRSTHIRKNHLKDRKISCEFCAKKFFFKSELRKHMLVHNGIKKFQCHLCDKSYQSRFGLTVHLKSKNHVHASEEQNIT